MAFSILFLKQRIANCYFLFLIPKYAQAWSARSVPCQRVKFCTVGRQTTLSAFVELINKNSLITDFVLLHATDSSKEVKRVKQGKFADQRYVLRHVTDTRSWNSAFFGSWFATEHPNITTVQFSHANHAREQSGFSTAASSQ